MSDLQVSKSMTRTDLRVTRPPADTPRGRLHRAAALGSRVAREVRRVAVIDADDLARARSLAQRGVRLTRGDASVGARLVSYLCQTVDRSLGVLGLLASVDLEAVCDGLTASLAQLEVAETAIRDLESTLLFERDHSERLRNALAAEQARSAIAYRDVPSERWEEPTRVTSDRMPALDPNVG